MLAAAALVLADAGAKVGGVGKKKAALSIGAFAASAAPAAFAAATTTAERYAAGAHFHYKSVLHLDPEEVRG